MKVLVYTSQTDLPRYARLLREQLPGIEFALAHTEEQAAPHLASTEVIYGWGFSLSLAARMPHLKWIQKMGAGVDDLAGEKWPFGNAVALTRTDGKLIAPRMVEYVLSAILNRTQKTEFGRQLRASRAWQQYETHSLRSGTIGVAGLGEIGSEIARTLKGLGANVIGWNRSSNARDAVTQLFTGADALEPFLRSSNTLVLVLPKTKETTHIINRHTLAQMPRGAHIINVGRGDLIEETALLDALDTGQLGHATLDVVSKEPLPPDHPCWNHPSVTLTPHISGPLIPEDVVPHFVRNVKAFLEQTPLQHVVTPGRQY